MRWVTYRGAAGDRVGLLRDDGIRALVPGVQLLDLLGDDGTRLREAGEAALADGEDVPLAAVRLQAPIPHPPTVRDF